MKYFYFSDNVKFWLHSQKTSSGVESVTFLDFVKSNNLHNDSFSLVSETNFSLSDYLSAWHRGRTIQNLSFKFFCKLCAYPLTITLITLEQL